MSIFSIVLRLATAYLVIGLAINGLGSCCARMYLKKYDAKSEFYALYNRLKLWEKILVEIKCILKWPKYLIRLVNRHHIQDEDLNKKIK